MSQPLFVFFCFVPFSFNNKHQSHFRTLSIHLQGLQINVIPTDQMNSAYFYETILRKQHQLRMDHIISPPQERMSQISEYLRTLSICNNGRIGKIIKNKHMILSDKENICLPSSRPTQPPLEFKSLHRKKNHLRPTRICLKNTNSLACSLNVNFANSIAKIEDNSGREGKKITGWEQKPHQNYLGYDKKKIKRCLTINSSLHSVKLMGNEKTNQGNGINLNLGSVRANWHKYSPSTDRSACSLMNSNVSYGPLRNHKDETKQHFFAHSQAFDGFPKVELLEGKSHMRNKSDIILKSSHKGSQISTSRETLRMNSSRSQRNRSPSFDSDRPIRISDFEIGLRKSQDCFGVVYSARHIRTGFVLCVKIVNKTDVKANMNAFIRGLKTQCFLESSHCIQIYGIIEEKGRIFVLMEYFQEGGLYLRIKSGQGLALDQSLQYFRALCLGVEQIHNMGVVGPNLKPKSISYLFNECKITNFLIFAQGSTEQALPTELGYCAPQTIASGQHFRTSDVWALGILLYEILVGNTPTHNFSQKRAAKIIQSCDFLYPSCIPATVQRCLRDIFQKQPSQRPSLLHLMNEAAKIQFGEELAQRRGPQRRLK